MEGNRKEDRKWKGICFQHCRLGLPAPFLPGGWGAISVQYTGSDAERKYHSSHEGLVKGPLTPASMTRLESKFLTN